MKKILLVLTASVLLTACGGTCEESETCSTTDSTCVESDSVEVTTVAEPVVEVSEDTTVVE